MIHPSAARLLIAAHVFIKERGYPPTFKDMQGDARGRRSTDTISYWRDRLQEQGWLKEPGRTPAQGTYGYHPSRSLVPNYDKVAFVREQGRYSVWEITWREEQSC